MRRREVFDESGKLKEGKCWNLCISLKVLKVLTFLL